MDKVKLQKTPPPPPPSTLKPTIIPCRPRIVIVKEGIDMKFLGGMLVTAILIILFIGVMLGMISLLYLYS